MSMGDDRVHIVLFGRAGAGKSAVGAELARATQRPFLDVDVAPALPRAYRCAIHPTVVDDDLTAVDDAEVRWFRSAVASSSPYVIAAPWCVIDRVTMNPATTKIVFLDAAEDELLGRLRSDGVDDHAAVGLLAAASNEARDATDQRVRGIATITIDTTGRSVADIVETLVQRIGDTHRTTRS